MKSARHPVYVTLTGPEREIALVALCSFINLYQYWAETKDQTDAVDQAVSLRDRLITPTAKEFAHG